MNWLSYRDFKDFCKQNNMTPEQGQKYLLNECVKRDLINKTEEGRGQDANYINQ